MARTMKTETGAEPGEGGPFRSEVIACCRARVLDEAEARENRKPVMTERKMIVLGESECNC